MSAVNVFVSPVRTVMLTDASLYMPDGAIVGFEQKAFPVDSWNGAVGGRGNWWGAVTAHALAEAHGSFDAFVALSGPVLEREHRGALERGELHGQTVIEVHVVGWSESEDRAKGYVLRSPMPFLDVRPAYVWRDHDGEEEGCFINGEMTTRENWMLHRQGAEPHVDFTAATFDPVRHGIPLMEAQRRKGVDPKMGLPAGMHVIGGHILLTVVDRDGTRQGIIHEWPDQVGESIEPAPLDESRLPKIAPSWLGGVPLSQFEADLKAGVFDPVTLEYRPDVHAKVRALPSAGMSRRERRAAGAQTRKGRAHAA